MSGSSIPGNSLANPQKEGGSTPTLPLQTSKYFVQEMTTPQMAEFTAKWHYSQTMPRLTKMCLGGFKQDRLVAAASFGWGSRPLHTIKRCFPSLGTKDYFELGRLCLEDDEPKNSESYFLSKAVMVLKKKNPSLKLVWTWADGMWGKPGYIYQASNYLYGGFIWTDGYMDATGRKVHPLQLQADRRRRGLDTKQRTQRPSLEEQETLGWKHYFGKQFYYIKFTCPENEQKALLVESTVSWTKHYPKTIDCEWKQQTRNGRQPCPAPIFSKMASYELVPKPKKDWLDTLGDN